MTEREAAILLRAMQRGDIEPAAAVGAWGASFGLPVVKFEDDVAEVLICKRCDEHHPLVYFDNAIAACSDCGVRVQYRPEMPTDALTRFRCLICEVKHQGLG